MSVISMADRRGFANRVCHKFDKFWQWKLPCPVDPVEDIYRLAYTDKEWIAMRYLMERKGGALKQSTCFDMYWADNHYIRFQFPNGMKLPNYGVHLDYLPDDVQCRVRSWVVGVNRFRQLREELKDRCAGVMGNPNGTDKYRQYQRRERDLDPKVNTAKQLYRLWPEIQPMMFSNWKRDVQLQSVKSPLPKRLGYQVRRGGRLVWATPEQFRCEDVEATKYEKQSFEEINQIMLMASLAGDVPHVEKYPLFVGKVGV